MEFPLRRNGDRQVEFVNRPWPDSGTAPQFGTNIAKTLPFFWRSFVLELHRVGQTRVVMQRSHRQRRLTMQTDT